MKKNLKRLFVLLLTFGMLCVFTGCSALDEMRKTQAFLNEDGTITWQGNTYKELPKSEYLNPASMDTDSVLVTAPDVPVLLSPMFSIWSGYASEDKQILTSFYMDEVHYCIDSAYDELCARIKAPFAPEVICYNYSAYNEETHEFENKFYNLTQEQIDAITLITETVTPTQLTDGMYLDTWHSVYLMECSKDMLFTRETMEISLSANEETYYLHLFTDDGEVLFTVPEGCKATFDDIFKAYMDGMGELIEGDLPADYYI